MGERRRAEVEHIGRGIRNDAVEQARRPFEPRRAVGHPVELGVEPYEPEAGPECLPLLRGARPRPEAGKRRLDAIWPGRLGKIDGVAPYPADAIGCDQHLEPAAGHGCHARSSSSTSLAGR